MEVAVELLIILGIGYFVIGAMTFIAGYLFGISAGWDRHKSITDKQDIDRGREH